MPQQTGYRVYKSDAAKAKLYAHRLAVADHDRQQWEDDAKDGIGRYENQVRANQVTPAGHRVNAPTGIGIIDALFSSLTATQVDILVEAIGNGSLDQAELATAALSKEWEVCKVNERVEPVIKDALLVGIGWAKVGYEYTETVNEVPRPMKDIAADIERLLSEADAAGVERPTADQVNELVPVTQEEATVLRDRVVVDHVPWDLIRWDPTAKRIEDVRWVAQLSLMHVEEVRANETWREYVKRSRGGLRKLDDLKSDTVTDAGYAVAPTEKPHEDDERVTVVEMHDFDTGTICTFVKGQDWLLNEQENPFAFELDLEDRSPFVPLILRSTSTRLRGISEMDVVKPSLDEKNLYRSRLANYLERMAPKLLAPEDGLTEPGKVNLKSREYGAVVEYAKEANIGDFKPLEPPALPSEVFDMDGKIEQETREATGVNELMRGLFPDRKRTATETAEVVTASAARQAEKRNRLENFYIRIARRMLHLMQAFYTEPRMLQYFSPLDNKPVWGQWKAEDIQMEYSMRLSLTPKEADTLQSRRDEVLSVINVFGPLATPGPDGSSTLNPTQLITWGLRKWGLSPADVSAILNTPEQQEAQRQVQQSATADQALAAQGIDPTLDAANIADVTGAGAVPPDQLAGALAGGPLSPELSQEVSESAGVRLP